MRIGEFSEQYDISTDTLRYYEKIGLLPTITRNENGIREYEEIDGKRIEFIKCMRQAGLPIEVLIEYFNLLQDGDETIAERKQILIDQRSKLEIKMKELQETYELLNYKIKIYEEAMLSAERDMLPIE
ncbi:MAG: MerR family transcriptional regulator, aldehyde-responsive regulator [Chloroflexota bacterium]|nr:MerR family transcriptional regulator, aldehyde-responsive regulator [Chloroflexota bacterium]